MIGKRIILVLGGVAVLVIVTGFLLGSLIAEQELAADQSDRPTAGFLE
jgi:glucose uptake protein GlcU